MGKITGRQVMGHMTPEMLVIGTRHPTDVVHVIIAAGQGLLERGAVIGRVGHAANESASETGEIESGTNENCYILGTEGCVAEYILAEDAESGEDSGGEDIVATAYRCGDFNKGALKVKEGYKITDEDMKNLRFGGIYLGSVM